MTLIPPILFTAALSFVIPFSWLLAVKIINRLFK